MPVWITLFDRFVGRWLFAFIALSALGLALLAVTTRGWVHLLLSVPGHLLIAGAGGVIAGLTRSPTRRRSAVTCLVGDLVTIVPNLFGAGGSQWRGVLTGALLLPVFLPAYRRVFGAQPADVLVGGVPLTPEVAAARRELASEVPEAHVHGFTKPVLVLNPRSGSVQAVRDELLEAAARYGVEVREVAAPDQLVACARDAISSGADALGVAGGDGSLAVVAALAIEAELPFVCVPAGTRNHFARDLGLDPADPAAAIEAFVAGPERRVDVATAGDRLFLNNASVGLYAALVHDPSYRHNWMEATRGVLEGMLERDALPVHVSFRDGSGKVWDHVLVLFVSNNAYPLSALGGRPRLDTGMLEVSALLRTEGQELGHALENLVIGRYDAGEGWARWITRSFEVDAPGGRLEMGVDGEAVVLDTPVRFRSRPGALRVLMPPVRPRSERPATAKASAPRRRVLSIAPTPEGRREQVAALMRLGRLLGQVGERQFGPERDEYGRPIASRKHRRPDRSGGWPTTS